MDRRDQKGRFLVGSEPGPGRPCGYDTSMDEQVYKLALLGLTDEQMAGFFDVSRNTFHRWRTENPGFCDAVHRGKEIADAEVAYALFKRASGMTVKSEKALKGKNGEIIVTQTVTEIPLDTKAAMHWLQLRKRGSYASEDGRTAELSPENERDLAQARKVRGMSTEELKARIEQYQKRRQISNGE